MTDKTAIQRIQELDRERTALFEQAKEEALRRANQAVEDPMLWGRRGTCWKGACRKEAAGSRSCRQEACGQVTGLKDRAGFGRTHCSRCDLGRNGREIARTR